MATDSIEKQFDKLDAAVHRLAKNYNVAHSPKKSIPIKLSELIAHGETRAVAIARMETALDETVIEGVATNIELHQDLLQVLTDRTTD